MSYLSISPTESALIDLNDRAIRFARQEAQLANRQILALGFALIVLQILDGVFTAIGVAHFGAGIEGNILIRHLIGVIGYIPALVVVKSIGIAVVIALCMVGQSVRWLGLAMKSVIAIYLFAAIIPWSFILIKHVI